MSYLTNLNTFHARLDKTHLSLDLQGHAISQDVWASKYKQPGDANMYDSAQRVVNAIYANDPNPDEKARAYDAITAGLFLPAGRIWAGAGTEKRVTLMNCYVNATVGDSMLDIMQANTWAALTMQQGGGVGTDFSTIRPKGAYLERTGTKASGPLPFMDMWHAMCTTIRSAGDRRGAMMGTMSDTHPDLPEFIVAKQTPGRLTNFNVSILVSDAFMEAVREDAEWALHFPKRPADGVRDPSLAEYDFVDEETDELQFVYSMWRARDLWELITKNTYKYSEPGVIFIDRVNELNNLNYLETIRCTNPCGEQPLPPHGTCNLGSVYLTRMVRDPFTDSASFDFDLLREVAAIATRFLDNVIDVTQYPLPEQRAEEFAKRRLGLGFTGLADVFAQLRVRYGSVQAADLADRITSTLALAAYNTSINLAKERGSFPLFDPDRYLSPTGFAGRRLPQEMQERIRLNGIRNGLILTVAPTGTISVAFGNPASGVEPLFAKRQDRSVLQADLSWKEYKNTPSYIVRLYDIIFGTPANNEYPAYIVEAGDLKVEDHIIIMAKVQHWIDASVSKTVNCPEDMTYEDFVKVYDLAYNLGCKSCTTYRPSDVRGSILRVAGKGAKADGAPETPIPAVPVLQTRPEVLQGTTYKIKWPRRKSALYLVINHDANGRPFECFITSKDASASEWTTALTLMITGIFRSGHDFSFIADELKQIEAVRDGAFIGGKYYGSIPAFIGELIGRHLNGEQLPTDITAGEEPTEAFKFGGVATGRMSAENPPMNSIPKGSIGEECPECHFPTLVKIEGCRKCTHCSYSECG